MYCCYYFIMKGGNYLRVFVISNFKLNVYIINGVYVFYLLVFDCRCV